MIKREKAIILITKAISLIVVIPTESKLLTKSEAIPSAKAKQAKNDIALITSIICLPISIYIIWQCFAQITITTQLVISMVIGVLIVVINLILAQRLIGWFTINVMEKIKC